MKVTADHLVRALRWTALLSFALALLTVVPGCPSNKGVPRRELPPATTAPTDALNKTEALVETAKTDVKSAGEAADVWWNETPADVQAKVAPQREQVNTRLEHADESLTLTGPELRTVRERVGGLVRERDWWVSYAAGADKQIQTLTDQNTESAKAVALQRTKTNQRWQWLGLVALALGVSACFLPFGPLVRPIGSCVAIFGATLFAGSFAGERVAKLLDEYDWIIGWSFVAVMVTLVGSFIVGRIRIARESKAVGTGFVDLANSIERIKREALDVDLIATLAGVPKTSATKVITVICNKVFGGDGILNTVQKPATKALVNVVQNKPGAVTPVGAAVITA